MNAYMTIRHKEATRLIWGFTVLLIFVAGGAALALFNSRQPEPPAQNGIMDLTGWDFAQKGTLLLADGWELYRDRLLQPEDFAGSAPKPDAYVRLPHMWGNREAEEGLATYRLQIILEPSQTNAKKALRIRDIHSAYRVYVNRLMYKESGDLGESPGPPEASIYPSILFFPVNEGSNEIIVQVSNSTYQRGGVGSTLSFGVPVEIYKYRERGLAWKLSVMTALATLGIYHLALFRMRKNDRMSLVISITCLLMSVRIMVLNDGILTLLAPSMATMWSKVEYFTLYAGIPFLLATIQLLYPREMSRRVTGVMWVFSGALCLSVLVLPVKLYSCTFIPFLVFLLGVLGYCLIVLALAVARSRTGAWINTLCIFIMIAAVTNDILFEQGWIQSVNLTPLSVFLFAFAETLVIAHRYSKAYVDVENVSGQLTQLNQQLEEKIKERTEALEITNAHLVYANEHLHQLETSRRELIANVTHELGTPMTSIQGYMKALLDGVIQPEKQYIQLLYDKIQMADRLVQDLFDLTKLEEGQTTFHMVDVIVDDLFDEYFSSFQWDVESQGIRFLLQKPESPQDRLPIARIDPIRIRQVITNLVHNALNYTEEGGSIMIRGEYGRDRLVIQVTDTGKGIDPKLLPHIFDRFVKGNGKKRIAKDGSGLGLAIAREIVMHHGGILTVHSEYGIGSTFQFDIPIEFIPMVVD
ncbi:MAG: integral rane sensor signal transduction histidine kinase [Paenibacillaceae bacterium]|nr:integral rane sensor signal transduction histidine kinase [Paenibacillaceae bacterium]